MAMLRIRGCTPRIRTAKSGPDVLFLGTIFAHFVVLSEQMYIIKSEYCSENG